MEDKEYQYENFKVSIKDRIINIEDNENNIFIGELGGQRFQILKDAIAYINAMMVLEELQKKEHTG